MAKQCIYCGHPLAKDDARFCNDCGQSQIAPASAGTGAAAPSAIKVKLPPKEFTRADSPSARQESSLPGRVMGAAPVSPPQRDQSALPSSRMPKRPARLTPESSAAANKVEPADDVFAARPRQTGSVPPAGPTPAEEISTMVLPNWREELAQLRKEQELAGTASPVMPEKKIERPVQEPPPLPRRSPNAPPPSRESGHDSPQIPQPRQPEKPLSESIGGTRAPQESARPADLPRRTPHTPLPQESASPAMPPQRAQNTPLPPPENTRSAEASRRELRVKVWEQEETRQYPQVQEEKKEPGPVAAIEQNPFASVAFGAEGQVMEVEDLKTVNRQAPLSSIPASPSRPPVREEKRPPVREESQPAREEKRPPTREESRPSVREESQPAREEKRPPVKEESRPPTREEGHRAVVEKREDDIEDLPTARLAVLEAQIKVERTSTPAPKKWAVPPTDEVEVEDLPTRPMAASSNAAGPAMSRAPQQPAGPQMQSGERRSEPGQMDSAGPFAQRGANPLSSPGTYGPASAAQPMGLTTEISVDPLASRVRPANPNSLPGQPFNPSSLSPLPPGPPSLPGNTQVRPETQGPQGRAAASFPDTFGQRPPSFEPAPAPLAASPSTTANVSTAVSGVSAGEGKKPHKKRHTGRLVVAVVLLLVFVGGGIGAWLNRVSVMQYFQVSPQTQPFQVYQNSAFGISLDYTQEWSVSVDQAHSTIRFADSSRTGQVNLIMAAASGQIGDYLNQQATQIPLSGAKTAPTVTFAGSSWQVLQGTGTQVGATYTIVLYATQHNGHFYMLEFLAPQSAFERIEKNSFAYMRSSFSFT